MFVQNNDNKPNLKKALAYLLLASVATAKTLSLQLQIVQTNMQPNDTLTNIKRDYESPFNVYSSASFITYKIGGESVSSLIDTGSSLLWFGNATSADPRMNNICQNLGCVDVKKMSPVGKDMGYKYSVYYNDGTGSTPEFFTSTLSIAGVSVNDFNFGVIDKYPNSSVSILGLRRMNGRKKEVNLISMMKTQGLISSESFSISYGGPITLKGGKQPIVAQGEIVFGGYNKDASVDPMVTFPISANSNINSLKSVSLKSTTGATTFIANVAVSGSTIIDSGTTQALTIPGISAIKNSIVTNKSGYWKCSDYEDYVVQMDFGVNVLEIPLNNMASRRDELCGMYFKDASVGSNIIGQYAMTNFISYWDYDSNVLGIKPVGNYSKWVGKSASVFVSTTSLFASTGNSSSVVTQSSTPILYPT